MNAVWSFLKWFGRNRRIQVIFFILVISVPVFLIIYGIVIPVNNYLPSSTPSSTVVTTNDSSSIETVQLDEAQTEEVQKIIRKENEKAFQKNRLALAEKDSIYMILNLPDSLLILEIKGVAAKRTKILEFEISHRFSLISHENLLPWIAAPFTLERDLSTIPKAPIVVKQAPKDTIEAAQMSTKPAPPDSTNVFFTLYFDRNLVVEIEQADPLDAGATEKVKTYRNIKRKESTRSVIQALRKPQQTDQPMSIKLVISEVEARAIYRAVPTKTHLILKL
jgi:predicted DNA binding CopG/RHH family protein